MNSCYQVSKGDRSYGGEAAARKGEGGGGGGSGAEREDVSCVMERGGSERIKPRSRAVFQSGERPGERNGASETH